MGSGTSLRLSLKPVVRQNPIYRLGILSVLLIIKRPDRRNSKTAR